MRDYVIANTAMAETFAQGLMTNKYSTGVITHPDTRLFKAKVVEILYTCMNAAATSPLSSIIDLTLIGAELSSNKERIHLFELISHMPHLQKLIIALCDLRNAPSSPYCACRDSDGLLKFLQYLPHSKVTSLDIYSTGLESFLEQSPLVEDYCIATLALISPPSNLRELEIGPCDNSCHEGSLTMTSLVSSPSTLRKLFLNLSNDCYLLNAFKTDNHLTELKIKHGLVTPGENWPALVPDIVRIIQHSTTLETLELSVFDHQKDRDVLMDIATALQRNKTLKHLNIHLEFRGDYELPKKTLQAIDFQFLINPTKSL